MKKGSESIMNYMHPCPACGSLVDCGDKPTGSRIRCKACGHRATFAHVAPTGPECWPECWDDHWQLGDRTEQSE